jgi:hypothetical protein
MWSLLPAASLAGNAVASQETPATAAVPVQDPTLRVYLDKIDRDWPGESYQQSLTAQSLILLADAIVSVAKSRNLYTPDLQSALDRARALTDDFGAAILIVPTRRSSCGALCWRLSTSSRNSLQRPESNERQSIRGSRRSGARPSRSTRTSCRGASLTCSSASSVMPAQR